MRSLLALVAIAGLIAGCGGASNSQGQNANELKMQQEMKANIIFLCQDQTIDCSILQGTPQDPNVQAYGSTLFVFTRIANTDLGKQSATDLCHLIAANDHNGDTAARIANINHVKVNGGSGSEELASCDTPISPGPPTRYPSPGSHQHSPSRRSFRAQTELLMVRTSQYANQRTVMVSRFVLLKRPGDRYPPR